MRSTHWHDGVGARGELARIQVHGEGLCPCSAVGQAAVFVGEDFFAAEIRILEKRHLLVFFVHNRHTHISEEPVGKIGEIAHRYIESFRQGELFFRLVGQTECAFACERQAAIVFCPGGGNGFLVGALGVSQNGFELSVEAQRAAAKFTAGLSHGHGLQVVVGIGSPVPTEIDVQEPFAIDAVDHHGMATARAFRIAGDVHGIAVLQLFVEHVDKAACTFVELRGGAYIVGEIVSEGNTRRVARGRTCALRIAHVNGCPDVMVQFADCILFGGGEIAAGVTIVHEIPCVV